MNKFLRIVSALGASLLLGVVVFVITLMLFPSASIFGVRYVGFLQEQQADSVMLNKDLSANSFIIESNEVDLQVTFSSSPYGSINYDQSFTGFTTSKIDEEYLTVKQVNGKCLISISDPKSIFFGYNRINNKVNIVLPDSLNNLSVNCEKSNVNFTGGSLSINTMSVVSSGAVNFNNKISAQVVNIKDCQVNVNKKIENAVVNINTNKTVNVNTDCSSVFNIETKNSVVNVASCLALNVTTATGAIKMKDGSVVSGATRIKTTSGDIKLQSISGKLDIETGYGNVDVGYADVVNVKNKSGSTNIDSTRVLNVESSEGDVSAFQVSEKANIITTTGKVTLAGQKKDVKNKTGVVYNANVSTTKGKIIATNLMGDKCLLESDWGNITVENCKVGKLKITSTNGNVKANDLLSENIQIISTSAIDISIVKMSGNVNIVGGTRAVNVSVLNGENYNYVVNTSSKKAAINVDGYIATGVSYKKSNGGNYTLKVTTSVGNVTIK